MYGMVFMAPIAPMAVYGFVVRDSFGMVPLVYLVGIFAMTFTRPELPADEPGVPAGRFCLLLRAARS